MLASNDDEAFGENTAIHRYSVKSNQVDVVVMAPNAWAAAKACFEFANGKLMDHFIYVREILVNDAIVEHSAQQFKFKWEQVAEAAGWLVE